MTDSFVIPVLWMCYLWIVFTQTKPMCDVGRFLRAMPHAVIVGSGFSLFIGLYEPLASAFILGIWASIPVISSCLFARAKVTVVREILAVHFAQFIIVSASIYFSALIRGFSAPAEAALWSETVDVSAVALSSVFQALYLIGDRFPWMGGDPSLRLARRVQIEERLDVLVTAEDNREVRTAALF
jgi:hypothetical protein